MKSWKRPALAVAFSAAFIIAAYAQAATCPEGVAGTPAADIAAKMICAAHAQADQQWAAGNEGTIVNVMDHGAAGDGVTNDAAAIQAALNSLDTGDVLLFPAGRTYAVGSNGWPGLVMTGKHRVKIAGEGATIKNLAPPAVNPHPATSAAFVALIVDRCSSCEINGLAFDNGGITSGALGAKTCTNTVFRNLKAINGIGKFQFWSTGGKGNRWISNSAVRASTPSTDTWGFYMGNTNPGYEDHDLWLIGNSVERERWDGYVLMAKGAVAMGNAAMDNPWSSMISPGYALNASRDHVIIGNYLKGALNHQYQVDFLPNDSSTMNGLVLFGNWLNGAGSGNSSTGAFLNDTKDAWVTGNLITDANHSGIQVTGNTKRIRITGNDIRDTRAAPVLLRGIKISPYGDSVGGSFIAYSIEDITIRDNSFLHSAMGVAVGANGENGGLRDRIIIDHNFYEGSGQNLSGALGAGVTIGPWATGSLPGIDASESALSQLADSLPAGGLRSYLDSILALIRSHAEQCTCASAEAGFLRPAFRLDYTHPKIQLRRLAGNLRFDIRLPNGTGAELRIYDIRGCEVMRSVRITANQSTWTLSLPRPNQGVYFAVFKTGAQRIVKRFCFAQ